MEVPFSALLVPCPDRVSLGGMNTYGLFQVNRRARRLTAFMIKNYEYAHVRNYFVKSENDGASTVTMRVAYGAEKFVENTVSVKA